MWIYITIKSHQTIYMVDEYGNVKNSKTNKILSVRPNKKGYLTVSLWHVDKRYIRKIHRLVAKAFVENTDELNKIEVNHKDSNRKNNYFKNLEWVTHLENIRHAIKNGYADKKGEKHFNAMITNKEAKKICEMILAGYSNKYICKTMNVSKGIVTGIKGRKTWKHIYDKIQNKWFNDYRKDDIYDVDLDDNYIYSISGILMTSK